MGRPFRLLKVHLAVGGRPKCGSAVTAASLTDVVDLVTCRQCTATGARTSNWKGDRVSDAAAHDRCRAMYPAPLGKCEADGCQKDARDRHHIDANPRNNARENIAFLCRGCHQKVDGRSEKRVAEMLATTPSMVVGRMPDEAKAKMSAATRAAWKAGVYERRLAARGADGKWSRLS